MTSQLFQRVRTSHTRGPAARAGCGLQPPPASKPETSQRSVLPVIPAVGLLLLCGCDPTINFYGSFFPGWTWCLLLGLLGTILLRFLFAALRLERNLGPLMLVYPCLLLLLTCVAWLTLFRY